MSVHTTGGTALLVPNPDGGSDRSETTDPSGIRGLSDSGRSRPMTASSAGALLPAVPLGL